MTQYDRADSDSIEILGLELILQPVFLAYYF